MADAQKPMQIWNAPPEPELRHAKTMVEDELLIKLGAKRELTEFHPLILAQRKERPRTSFVPEYRRVKPPYQEKQAPNRNPWSCSDQALRQMSNVSRQGPRKLNLPSLQSNRPLVRRVSIPTEDKEYKELRLLRMCKRDEILEDWPALQHQAFSLKHIIYLNLPETEPYRKYSSASISSSNSALHVKSALSNATREKRKSATVPYEDVPPTGKPRSRWRSMARQYLWMTKAAQMGVPKEQPRSEVRIYVSCTQDMSEEREFLAEVAYPELRRFCEKQGLTCYIVDLRHGVNHLKNDRETNDVIKREMTKCNKISIGPCFVSLVGRQSDDENLPGWLSKEDMLTIRSVMVKQEDVVAVEALDNLYRLDSNYNPPIYTLEERRAADVTVEKTILQNVFPEIMAKLREEGKMSDDPGYYPWSSTVKEIETGILSCFEPKQLTLCLMARSDNDNADPAAPTGNIGADKLRLAILDYYNHSGAKHNLIFFKTGKKNVMYLREICGVFLSAVTKLVERQIKHHDFDISHYLCPAADVSQHVRVARQLCTTFLGGDAIVERVQELFSNPATAKPVVIVGTAGSGKTSLASVIASSLASKDPVRKIVFRIAGITLSSSSLLHLLKSVHSQIAFLYDIEPGLPSDITLKGLLQSFKNFLQEVRERITQKGPLTIVLDGIDNLPDMQSKHLTFLLGSMPMCVTLVISMCNSGHLWDSIRNMTGVEIVHCPQFTARDVRSCIETFLSARGRLLTNDQIQAILKELNECSVPLVAKIAASMASRWPSHTLNDDLDITSDMESAFHRLVESCEAQLGHKFTRHVFSLLAASRYGLAEFEILHILLTDSDLINDIKEEEENLSVVEGYPYQFQLSRLLLRIEPFLYEVKTEGETVVKISHSVLLDVLQKRYLSDSFKHHIHSRLATYFQFTRRGHLLSSRDIVENKHKNLSRCLWRTLRSVPYHLCHAYQDPSEAWKMLKSTVFMKFTWIINEIYCGFFNDFMSDMNYALKTLGLDPDMMFMRQFISNVRQTVIYNPVSLASLMAGQDMDKMETLQNYVTEAQDWLKQVHLQVLVPTSYSSQSASQLLVHPTLVKRANSVLKDSTGDQLIIQYSKSLSLQDHLSGEETVLASFPECIQSVHLWGQGMLTVRTESSDGESTVDTYALDKGKRANALVLKDSPITWFHVRSDGMAYYATGNVIKRIVLEKGSLSEQFKLQEEIVDACMPEAPRMKIVTLHTFPKTLLRVHDLRDPFKQSSINLQHKVISHNAKPLLMTKDNVFVVVACEREVLIVDLNLGKVASTLTFDNVPVALVALSRSHEHVFVVTPTGVVQCFNLSKGTMVMDIRIKPREMRNQHTPATSKADTLQPSSQLALTSKSSPSRANSSTKIKNSISMKSPPEGNRTPVQSEKPSLANSEVELITNILTSEDDHFLLAASSQGHVHVLHVPTSMQVCTIATGQSGLKQLVYLTNASWFQHLVTLDVDGLAKLWNLRPLLSRARTLIKDVITDKDLLREEETKQDLGLYFVHFKERCNDRIFLNGPDIHAFYKSPVPDDLFSAIPGFDPALQMPSSWQTTGRLGDCLDVCALTTGCDLSEVLITSTSEGEIARWNLNDGSLQFLQLLAITGTVDFIRPVYYDQALFIITKGNNSKTAKLLPADEKKLHPLVQENVLSYNVSDDGTTAALVLSDNKKVLRVRYWNLLTGEEQGDAILSNNDRSLVTFASNVTFSQDLSACAAYVPQEEGTCVLFVWTSELTPDITSQNEVIPDTIIAGQTSDLPRRSESANKKRKDFIHKQVRLQYIPTKLVFATSQNLLFGTSLGLITVVSMETLTLTTVLSETGMEPISGQSLTVLDAWSSLSPPHKTRVLKLSFVPASHVIVSTSSSTLCAWNFQHKKLLLKITLSADEFVLDLISRDCQVVCYATASGVLSLWGVRQGKQLCSYRLQCAVTSLSLTPDCRRVVLIQDDEVTQRVRVFDVRNIDDITLDTDKSSKQINDK